MTNPKDEHIPSDVHNALAEEEAYLARLERQAKIRSGEIKPTELEIFEHTEHGIAIADDCMEHLEHLIEHRGLDKSDPLWWQIQGLLVSLGDIPSFVPTDVSVVRAS